MLSNPHLSSHLGFIDDKMRPSDKEQPVILIIFSRNPPPSFMEGGMGGSAVDRIGADTDALLSIPDD
jgi:hypothetical protein